MGEPSGSAREVPRSGAAFDVVNLSLGGVGCDGIASRPSARAVHARASPISPTSSTEDDLVVSPRPATGREREALPGGVARPADDPTMLPMRSISPSAGAPHAGRHRDPPDPGRSWRIARSPSARGRTASVTPFSNCGAWVNAIAAGADAVGAYPDADRRWPAGAGRASPRHGSARSRPGARIRRRDRADAIGIC